jgi:pimeloyl-ACP methyl ester carboxylesterase
VIRARSSDDVGVAVHHFGGTGTPLLLSHATGFHGWCYRPLALRLADRFDAWAIDYRGHGSSTQPAGWQGEPLDWRGCGDDAIAALEAIDPPAPVVAFGHSMGAAVLLMAARRRPELFERLVLFEPIVYPPLPEPIDPETITLVIGARRRRNRFDSYEQAHANFAGKPPMGWFEPDVLRCYVDHGLRPVADPDGDAGADGVELCCSGPFEAATFSGSITNGVWDLLPGIATPTLVLAGVIEGDQPSRFASDIAERLPAGTYLGLPHMTHFGPFTHVDEIARLIVFGPAADAP